MLLKKIRYNYVGAGITTGASILLPLMSCPKAYLLKRLFAAS